MQTLAAGVTSHTCAPFLRPSLVQLRCNRLFSHRKTSCRSTVRTMASQLGYEAWVKGDPKTKTLGDCPFCHRVLLALEEKQAPYSRDYVDFADKPKWLLEVNPEGSVPVVKDRETGEWFTDSAKFVDYLEDKQPAPALGKTPDVPEVGSQVFPKFVAAIKAAPEDKSVLQPVEEELQKLNSHLEADGPFLKGQDISSGDLALAPKLHHMQVALKEIKGFEIPANMSALHKYLETIRSRQSWQNTQYSDDLVLGGWKPKVGSG